MKNPPKITVGIMDRRTEVFGRLDGNFRRGRFGLPSGGFSAEAEAEMIVLVDEAYHEICRSKSIRLTGQEGSAFSLFNVTIGDRFHWERTEDQTFLGDLTLAIRKDGTLTVINEISLEDYLTSVISSEMSSEAPLEFLRTQAILSRSWLLAALDRKKKKGNGFTRAGRTLERDGEVIRWYDREDHEHFDVCADDHCQRYQGITKILSEHAKEAVRGTRGIVITHHGEICDTRYSKACGGITEDFDAAWEDKRVPYLRSISDASVPHRPMRTEEEASAWILSTPEAYCCTQDERLLEKILPDFDRETKGFFRWRVEYSRTELEQILLEKSGFDFGTLQEILPLRRGPSGRISRLRIVGSKRSMVVGKELEIRRWLSRSHLYSSAFIVKVEGERFIFQGAGWGHGVGLCQIGAAVMAAQGFSAEKILKHYFQGIEIKKIY
ncbi:MAG TPA: SpoIID/LytB domain-containing protein [Thermodesulfobacteriota bacterium]|nr:SpoIID/LytB domain-containing protein [Thermodesulfobacteriota bacterium]